MGEFLCSHLNIDDGEKKGNVFCIVCFAISKKVKMQLKCKDICSNMEKVLWFTECVKSGLQSFTLEISQWTMLPGPTD